MVKALGIISLTISLACLALLVGGWAEASYRLGLVRAVSVTFVSWRAWLVVGGLAAAVPLFLVLGAYILSGGDRQRDA
jgi:hypothetical protein